MLLTLTDINIAFGEPPLLENISFRMEKGERICIVGRNGSGKSTLLKIMAEKIEPDSGTVAKADIRISYLPQEVPGNIEGSVFDVVASMIGKTGELIAEYRKLERIVDYESNPEISRKLELIGSELDKTGDFSLAAQIETVIDKMKLNPDDEVRNLSGGQKRRVLLAGGIAGNPDILLLDEPTNHLDTETITWLEDFLLRNGLSLIFVTHDRAFLKKIATRIIELDRGKLINWNCNYETWLKRKERLLSVEAEQNYKFDKKLAAEEAWLRQGIKARRTRNEGRLRALLKLREERKARRSLEGKAKISVEKGSRGAKIVAETGNLTFSYDGKNIIVKDLTTRIARGDKVGIIGPNGSGKTTLIKLLLKELEPTSGWVKNGAGLEIVYFDQLRDKLDETKTVKDSIADGKDTVIINGRQKHIFGYLKEFLFSPERARTPVSVLSGGERNRLLLAKLFTKPSNVLVMDEPTNDLDVETLELLEDILVKYEGTLLLVSHDRAFLNNVVTSTLVFEGNGKVGEYVGGYDDWLLQRKPQIENKIVKQKKERVKNRPRKLSYNENKELERLPAEIEEIESEISEIQTKLADPDFYKNEGDKVQSVNERLKSLEDLLEKKYERWSELEEIRENYENMKK